MKTLWRAILTAAVLMAFVPQMAAQDPPPGQPVLLGTTGACDNVVQGGPCIHTSAHWCRSTREPAHWSGRSAKWENGQRSGLGHDVGQAVRHNRRWRCKLPRLDHHRPQYGKQGTPVNPSVVNYGLDVTPGTLGSPVHSITIDSSGNAVGWYDEFGPGVTDTFVTLDKATGLATEFNNTGINTGQNGLCVREA